ncbi:MAG: RsmE family RNA methyltransferase [Myxococcota bacterium]|nr:RsmE family RNA methyltransferase [Myxococcota bacterium]
MTVRLPTPYLNLTNGGPWPLDESSIHYVIRVRRLQDGSTLIAFDGQGREIDVKLTLMDGQWSLVRLGPVRSGQLGAPLTVYYGLPKGEKIDRVTRQLTELGVYRLVPLLTTLSVVRLAEERRRKKHSRLCRIASEAARQCGRSDVMQIDPPMTVQEALRGIPTDETVILFDPDVETRIDGIKLGASMSAFIGPESGFSTSERQEIMSLDGAQRISLGSLTLRTETAAPVCAALLLYRMGYL